MMLFTVFVVLLALALAVSWFAGQKMDRSGGWDQYEAAGTVLAWAIVVAMWLSGAVIGSGLAWWFA